MTTDRRDADLSPVSARELRAFILDQYEQELGELGQVPAEVPDDFDLHEAGIIDSFGLVELLAEVQERFGVEVDFELLDPDQLTAIGPLTRFIEQHATASQAA